MVLAPWKSPFDSETTEIAVPACNSHATVADLEELIEGKCFDGRIQFDNLKTECAENGRQEGNTYQINVVRWGTDMNSTPLGNLWWVAVARLQEVLGANIEVNGFYTGNPPKHNNDINEMREKTGLKTDHLYPAESFGWNEVIFRDLSGFIETNRGTFSALLREAEDDSNRPILATPGFRGSKSGIQAVVDGDIDTARNELYRLVEELHVFMHGHDDKNTHLLLNHERLSPALLRLLYPDMRKRFVNVALPKNFNEFRGGKGEVKKLFQRTIKRPENEDEQHYQSFARALVDVLSINKRGHLDVDDPSDSVVGEFDGRLAEWVSGKISSHVIPDVIRADGFERNADDIATLLVDKNTYTLDPKALLKPIKALMTKIHGDDALVVRTYVTLLRKSLEERGRFTFCCAVNQLLDRMLELPACNAASTSPNDASEDGLGADIAEARRLVEGQLCTIAKTAWQMKATHTFSMDIDMEAMEAKLSTFLGKKITLPHKVEHNEHVLEMIDSLIGNQDHFDDQLWVLNNAICGSSPNATQMLLKVFRPKLNELQRSIDKHHRQELIERMRFDEKYIHHLQKCFDEGWCTALAREAMDDGGDQGGKYDKYCDYEDRWN
jgi:hypothetical protein